MVDSRCCTAQIESPTVAYETWGQPTPAGDNAVLLFTGLSPSAHAASSPDDPTSGWWEDMIGPDKPIDTSRLYVVCVNSLGSCFGSTGPASERQEGGSYRLDFPVLTLEDIARAGHAVVEHLGLTRLKAVVGRFHGRNDRPRLRHPPPMARRRGSSPSPLQPAACPSPSPCAPCNAN